MADLSDELSGDLLPVMIYNPGLCELKKNCYD